MRSVLDEFAHGGNQGKFGHVEQWVVLAGRPESGFVGRARRVLSVTTSILKLCKIPDTLIRNIWL